MRSMAWLDDARAFADTLFSTDQAPVPAARLDWLMDELRDFVHHAGPRTEVLLRGGLFVAEWAAPLTAKKLPPMSRLTRSDRQHALEALERTPAGLPILAVKAILCILYYEHPEVLAECGIVPAGTCLTTLRKKGAQ